MVALFWLEDVDGDGMKEILYFMNQNSFFGSAAGNADNKIWVLDADSDQIGSMEDHTLFKDYTSRSRWGGRYTQSWQ